jgi:Na+/phosphate symporter
MVGEVSAVLGIADISFRGISALYDFVKDLRNVPKEVERIKREICALQKCLTQLSSLRLLDSESRAALHQVGLPEAVERCGKSCSELLALVQKRMTPGKSRVLAQLQYHFKKKDIESLLADLEVTKQTTVLTVVTTTL